MNTEYRMQMKNEEVAFCEVFAWKEIDEHGKVVRLIGNLINVNQRVEAEQRLNAKINQLEAVINNGFSYMLLLDKEGYILNLDEASRTLIKEEFSVDPKLNKVKLPDVIPHNLLGPFDTNFAQALKGEVVSDFVERTVKSGQTLSAQRIYKPILNEQSEIDSVLVILVDLT
jgi:two-component system cell cycle sensor histidine kinase PleC